MEDSPAEQANISPADRIRPWQFKKGQSGNPSGRPKGSISLKEWAKNYIQTLTDEERLEFLEGMNKKDVWEMAEGKPQATSDVNVKLDGALITSNPELDKIREEFNAKAKESVISQIENE